MAFKVEARGFRELLHDLTEIEQRALPYATAAALTRTVVQIRSELTDEMRIVFDRPTPYTLRAFEYVAANKDKLYADVFVRSDETKPTREPRAPVGGRADPASVWLVPQIYGGERQLKRSERQLRRSGILQSGKYLAAGKGAKLDRYGNISRGDMTKAMSGIRAFTIAGYSMNASGNKRSEKKGNARSFFVMQRKGIPIGIAQRTSERAGGLSILMAFVSKPNYEKRLKFYELCNKVAEQRYPLEFSKALADISKKFKTLR